MERLTEASGTRLSGIVAGQSGRIQSVDP
jgi:hypothetical protein